MATQLRPHLNSLSLPTALSHGGATTSATLRHPTIRCGPRDNRGPLVKGRVLSSEAIQAVQALKRAQRSPNPPEVSRTLSRLIKADLLATLREVLRQGHCTLALQVFSAVRSEPWYKPDLGLYADLVVALAKEGMTEDIDRLIAEMEGDDDGDGVIDLGDKKGLSRLIKALIGAQRRESTVRIYGVMKRVGGGVGDLGWSCNWVILGHFIFELIFSPKSLFQVWFWALWIRFITRYDDDERWWKDFFTFGMQKMQM